MDREISREAKIAFRKWEEMDDKQFRKLLEGQIVESVSMDFLAETESLPTLEEFKETLKNVLDLYVDVIIKASFEDGAITPEGILYYPPDKDEPITIENWKEMMEVIEKYYGLEKLYEKFVEYHKKELELKKEKESNNNISPSP